MTKIIDDLSQAEMVSQREVLGEAILEAARQNEKVIALTADVGDSTRLLKFREEFPDRYFDFGVSEQAMVGAAAGLSMLGFIPFGALFGAFEAGRAYDHIRVSIGINKANVVLVGSHVGLSNPGDGATAQSLTDISLMKSIPGMTIVTPADAIELKKTIKEAVSFVGPLYVRVLRDATAVFTTEETPFSFGQAEILREGTDVSIIANGPVVYNALCAAQNLAHDNINCEIIDCHTVKPLDETTILASVQKTKAVVTLEEHTIPGGFGESVGRVLSANYPVVIEHLGIRDENGQSARKYDELQKYYGVGAEGIERGVIKVLEKKKIYHNS